MRLVVVVGLAVVAALVTAVGVVLTRSSDPARAAPPVRPLHGRPPLVIAPSTAVLKTLPAGDVRVRVARLLRADDDAHRLETIAGLKQLPQKPVVTMALGLAELWAGDVNQAERYLQQTRQLDPYGYYGTKADNLLHINQELPGYPPWIGPPQKAEKSVAALRERTRLHPDDEAAWLDLASAIETPDRLGAARAARQAAVVAPDDPDAAIASLVLGFSKDRPMTTLDGLRQIVAAHPASSSARLHLGIVYHWLKDDNDAQAQFRQVVTTDRHSYYGRVALLFSQCLQNPSACVKAFRLAGS